MNYDFDEKKLLDLFVSDDDCRPMLNCPYRRDGYVYATDSYKLVRIKEDIVSGNYELTDRMKLDIPADDCDYTITDKDIKKVLSEIPQVEELEEKEVKCPECNGTNEVFWEYKDKDGEMHERSFECPVCDGTGYILVEKATGRMIPDPSIVIRVGKNGIKNTNLEVLLDAMRIIGVTEVHLVGQNGIVNHFRIDENISILLASNICIAEYELKLRKGGER